MVARAKPVIRLKPLLPRTWDISEFELADVREQVMWFPATPFMVHRLGEIIEALRHIYGVRGCKFLRDLGDLEEASASFPSMRASAIAELTMWALGALWQAREGRSGSAPIYPERWAA